MSGAGEARDMREAVVEELTRAVDDGRDVVVLVSDSTSTSGIAPFAARHPGRLVNVGIAEQNLLGIAAGLSLTGTVSVTANAACFLVARSCEQLKTDVCYSRTNVKMLGLNAGVAYGPLASTHHAINDVAVLRSMGEILIFAPADAAEAAQVVRWALEYDGPVYVRMDSAPLPSCHSEGYRFVPGALDALAEGSDAVIFSLGTLAHEALRARSVLADQGISAAVVSVPSLRPADTAEMARRASRVRVAVTAEEHSVSGGLGSLVCESLAEHGVATRVVRLGIPDGEFAAAGPRAEIRAHYGLDGGGIARAVERALRPE